MTATKVLSKIKLPNFTFHSVYKACTFPHIEFIRFGPHRLEHRSSAAPELASAYPPGGATIYGNYVLQMTATNLLSKINLQKSFWTSSSRTRSISCTGTDFSLSSRMHCYIRTSSFATDRKKLSD